MGGGIGEPRNAQARETLEIKRAFLFTLMRPALCYGESVPRRATILQRRHFGNSRP